MVLKQSKGYIAVRVGDQKILKYRENMEAYQVIGLLSDLGGLAKITFASLFGIPKSEFNQWLIIKKL